jgi:hypothetical protein
VTAAVSRSWPAARTSWQRLITEARIEGSIFLGAVGRIRPGKDGLIKFAIVTYGLHNPRALGVGSFGDFDLSDIVIMRCGSLYLAVAPYSLS